MGNKSDRAGGLKGALGDDDQLPMFVVDLAAGSMNAAPLQR